jgi:hypothetical protein
VLKHCGGHAYPTLAFIEHFFTDSDGESFLTSMEEFQKYFCGPDFPRTSVYKKVKDRCFDELDGTTTQVASRVLQGEEGVGDIETLWRLGWWNPEDKFFISAFLVNTCLSAIPPVNDGARYLSETMSHEENTELAIIEGLSGMEDSDFYCSKRASGFRVENSISFSWAGKMRAKIPNAYLSFQERGNDSSLVDFYLNGLADTAIEVLRDATQTVHEETKGQSQDMDGHLGRFLDNTYPWKRFVLLNFNMKRGGKIILPRNETFHDKVYTYVHETNTLYRGNERIKCPAVPKLSGGSRPFL